MCIIIDTNAFASIFEKATEDHQEFRAILEWVCQGKGKIVYGGTKYKNELRAATKYLKLLGELQTAGKIVEIKDKDVDQEQEKLEEEVDKKDFDDPHLIAIIIVSKCKLICSKDKRAYKFIKNQSLYPKHVKRPRIYSNSSNADLLCDQNIAECCKPLRQTKLLSLKIQDR